MTCPLCFEGTNPVALFPHSPRCDFESEWVDICGAVAEDNGGEVRPMGLSIYWEFVAEGDFADGIRKVQSLHAAAEGAGFDEVGKVVEAYADKHIEGDDEAAADRAWVLSQGLVTLHPSPTSGIQEVVRVAPLGVVGFRASSAGAEDAVFGLAVYPPSVQVGAHRIETHLGGLRWSSGASTQGAAKRSGMPGFLRAHRAIVMMLDKARGLGLKVHVKDDGGFWEKRDQKGLLDKLEEWEGLMAALGRQRRDGRRTVPLACDVKPILEAKQKERRRLDREPIEELEG